MSLMLRCERRMVFDYVPFKNRLSLGESDCLIKTKQRDKLREFFPLCDFCPVP